MLVLNIRSLEFATQEGATMLPGYAILTQAVKTRLIRRVGE
jgi:hypothetical protein